jgi:hypothetical protein
VLEKFQDQLAQYRTIVFDIMTTVQLCMYFNEYYRVIPYLSRDVLIILILTYYLLQAHSAAHSRILRLSGRNIPPQVVFLIVRYMRKLI